MMHSMEITITILSLMFFACLLPSAIIITIHVFRYFDLNDDQRDFIVELKNFSYIIQIGYRGSNLLILCVANTRFRNEIYKVLLKYILRYFVKYPLKSSSAGIKISPINTIQKSFQ